MKTIVQALNNYLSYPEIIKCKNGRERVKTSESLIEKNYVQVNGITVIEDSFIVKNGDLIRLTNKRNDCFYVY